jgi:hypothetical protein
MMGSRYWYCAIAEHLSFLSPQWCHRAAEKIGFRVERIEFFSHSSSSLKDRVADLGKNVLYRFAPMSAGWLRSRGFGGIDVKEHPNLMYSPPPWMSARDHMIVMFRKR